MLFRSFTLGFRYHGGLSRHRGVSMPIPPKDLQRALREYYTNVAEWERGFAEEHRLKNALDVYDELFQRLEGPEVFPIRVGFGSGRLALRRSCQDVCVSVCVRGAYRS